jgi:hypothetical protein
VPVSVRTVTMITLASPAKLCCLDPLPTPLLKNSLSVLAVPITRIANASLASGLVTDSLKHAVISPLIKKSSLDQQGFSNYRLVSGLPFLSKLIERVMLKQLASHIEDFQLLMPIQSAYRVNYSTETALLAIKNDLLSAADAGMGSALLLLDLSAAFDNVDHQILLKRLASTLGVTGSVSVSVSRLVSVLSIGADTISQSSGCHIVAHSALFRCSTGICAWTVSFFRLHQSCPSHRFETWKKY